MKPAWQNELQRRGALIQDGRVVGFASAPSGSATQDTVVCDLSHLGLIEFEGADARAFLHGQLSCDVQGLGDDLATLGSYNTPKGRVLAVMLLWSTSTGLLAQLPAELIEPIRKRLSMYILRAKVRALDVGESWARFGVVGPRAAQMLAEAGIPVPGRDYGVGRGSVAPDHEGGAIAYVLQLPGQRFQLMIPDERSAALFWDRLTQYAPATSANAWELAGIRAGDGYVVPATQDRFVAQMLNLDLTGGVSFTKGCYPGQEIVARSHYLGRLKRRMMRARIRGPQCPRAGDELHCPALADQAAGTIVATASCGAEQCEVLAVIQLDLMGRDDVAWGSLAGPRLEWLPLPYPIPAAELARPG